MFILNWFMLSHHHLLAIFDVDALLMRLLNAAALKVEERALGVLVGHDDIADVRRIFSIANNN